MAIDLLANVLASIPQQFDPQGVDLQNREAPHLAIMGKQFNGSQAMTWTVSDSGATASEVGEVDDIDSSEYTNDNRLMLTLPRARFRQTFGVSSKELAVCMNSRFASDMIADLVGGYYLGAKSALARRIETQCFKGTGTATSPKSGSVDSIYGVLTALITTGTYAGKDVSTYTNMKSNITTSVGTLDKVKLRTASAAMKTKSGSSPEYWMGSPATVNQVVLLGDALQHITTAGSVPTPYHIGTPAFANGSPRCYFDGVPVFENSAWDDGYLLGACANSFALDILNERPVGDAFGSGTSSLVSNTGDRAEQLGIPVTLYSVGRSGPTHKFALEVELGMKVRRGNATVLLKGITIP